jgi:Arc/MetJ family transcription regulator
VARGGVPGVRREAIRCLKRYIAREIYQDITRSTTRHRGSDRLLDIHRGIKLAITYRAAAVLHACIRWLRLLGDTA